LPNERRPIQV